MLETITLITLTLVLISVLRPGKTPPLDNPLVIERPRQYHMTLAPQINLAQPFIEALVKKIGPTSDEPQFSQTQYFEVRDNQVTAHGHDYYLLAITQCNSMLYFQAASPMKDDLNVPPKIIHELAGTVLKKLTITGEHKGGLDERIIRVTQETAQLRSIQTRHLPNEIADSH
jgi:hypothetical protein